jgi:ABC-type amino acid transport substrate-binding protein
VDDERLLRRVDDLGILGEPDPDFLERMYSAVAIEAGFAPRVAPAPRRMASGLSLLAAVIALLAALVAGTLVVGSVIDRTSPPRGGLLDEILARGTLRLAIRPDFPQVSVGGRPQGGFDEDVALELAARLGVAPQPLRMGVDEMGATSAPAWDLAFPSQQLPADVTVRFAASEPYYTWPVYLIVPDASDVTSMSDLAGATICSVTDSTGAKWVAGASVVPGSATAPPEDALLMDAASDDECLQAVVAGDAAAAVSFALLPADVEARAAVRLLGEPVVLDARGVLIPRGREFEVLVAAINDTLREMREDSTLSEFSRRRFGGLDVTQ